MQRIIIKALPTFFQKASLSYSRNSYSASLISGIPESLLFSEVHLLIFLLSMTYPLKNSVKLFKKKPVTSVTVCHKNVTVIIIDRN